MEKNTMTEMSHYMGLRVTRIHHSGMEQTTDYPGGWDDYYNRMYMAMSETSDDWGYEFINDESELDMLFDDERLDDVRAQAAAIGYPIALISRGQGDEVFKHTDNARQEFLREWDGHDLRGIDYNRYKL